jgi:hypothetical protein
MKKRDVSGSGTPAQQLDWFDIEVSSEIEVCSLVISNTRA